MDELTEVFDRKNTRPQGRQIQQSWPINLISKEAEAEDTDIFWVMTLVEEVIDNNLMTGIEEDILLLDPNPEDIILQEVPVTGRTITTIEVTAGSPDLKSIHITYQKAQSCI